MKSNAEAEIAVHKYADTVRRVCFMRLKNYNDTEDIFQEVFLKYILRDEPFESDAHEKAWLIRVTINASKDTLKSFLRRKVLSIDDVGKELFHIEEENKYVLDAVLKLPDNYKNVIYLFYYEGYSAVEIAEMLSKKENTIYTWLSRARAELKDLLGGEYFVE